MGTAVCSLRSSARRAWCALATMAAAAAQKGTADSRAALMLRAAALWGVAGGASPPLPPANWPASTARTTRGSQKFAAFMTASSSSMAAARW